MTHRYIRLSEVVGELRVEEKLIRLLETEQLIHIRQSSEGEAVLSADDVDRIRLAQLLTDELEVNLPGVEVVVHMREEMLAMRRQFAEILETIVAEIRRQLERDAK